MNKKILLFLVSVFMCTSIFAQTQTMTGKVTDGNNEPVVGATITEIGTSNVTSSDVNGGYAIKVPVGAKVSFAFFGMETQEVVFEGKSVDVVLKEDAQLLDEVVVIGYQSIRKVDLTGAVSVFKPDLMKNTVVTGTVADALGTLPGVYVRTEGRPGAEGFVVVRGTSSFGTSQPLYVIDGIAVEGGANRDFNYNDIESIQVLKDASAAAIYGSRAANGVIIITTKQGSEGQMVIDAQAKVTAQWLPRYNLADRDRWIELNDMAFANNGRNPANHFDANTDWQNEVFKTGIVEDYNISFSGGGKYSKYFFSTNYQSNSGTTIGTDSKRFAVRANSSGQRDWANGNVVFRFGENITISDYVLNNLNTSPITDVWRMLPTIPVYDDSHPGGFGYGDGSRDVTFGTNPIAKEALTETQNENFRVRGNAFAELELFKMFKYRFNAGIEVSNDQYKSLRKEGNWTYNQPYDPSSLNKNKARFHSLVFDNTLEFNKTWGKHQVNAIAGISYQETAYDQLWGTKNNVLVSGNGYFDQLDAALSDPKTGSYRDITKLFSIFGRVNYTFDNKYLFSATVRQDQSSKFAPQYRTGTFPSVSAGWRISQEKFFDVSWINDLKIRGNYGVLGSSNIGAWDYIAFINLFPQIALGKDQHIENGMTQVKLVNENLKWEELHQWNVGFDAALFNNRFTVSMDYYNKTTKDVLTQMQILMSTGNNGGNPVVNAASLQNRGFEFSLGWQDKKGDWSYNVNWSGSTNKNTVLDLGYGKKIHDSGTTITTPGNPLGQWYIVKTAGIFQSMDEVMAHRTSDGKLIQPNALPGDIRYVDFNDDGMITDADRQYCGETQPSFQTSLTAGVSWKGLELSLILSGSFGAMYMNGPRRDQDRFHDNSNYRADYDPWTPSNPNAKDPRPVYDDSRNAGILQDRWLEKGDYVRVSQISLSYSLPKKVLGDALRGVRVFVAGQNLITITGYKGLDPEFYNANIWDRTYDYGSFPNPKGVTFGAQITF